MQSDVYGSVKCVKMLRPHYCLAFLAIVATATAKKPPTVPAPWAAYPAAKPMYSRSLGPPFAPAMSTITVPYIPKASPFFPKFVDPQAMIAKKTDMLTNLFAGLGPVNYPPGAVPYQQPPAPLLYTTSPVNPELQEILGADKTSPSAHDNSKVARAAKYSPFSPKFGPKPPKFGPFAPLPGYASTFPFNAPEDGESRRKREATADSETSRALGPPPAYPGLGPIPEEPETDPSAAPKQFLPGIFSPFGPFGPSPVIDPSFFISKKTAFLDTLFKNLATSTPAPPDTVTDPTAPKPTIVPPNFWVPFNIPTEASAPVTEVPVPKSTIVPADFWIPSSVIPGPTEYNDKVSQFLDKLFDSLKLNKTLDSTLPKAQLARAISEDPAAKAQFPRSLDDLQTITSAKDAIVDSIITELSSIKADMEKTMNDLIIAQKTAVPASKFAKKPPKPSKPISPWAVMFAPPTTMTPDLAIPFQQKISVLSQVFDMLTGLQKNISVAIQESAKSSATEAPVVASPLAQVNATLLEAIKAKLDSLDKPVQPQPFTGFWGTPYSGSSAAKRNVDDEFYGERDHDQDHDQREQYKRAVKMTMHQGYQSMPPGTIETVQAGGGSVPGHQGGGIKLLENFQDNEYENYGKQWAQWADFMKSKNQNYEQRHHHNHH